MFLGQNRSWSRSRLKFDSTDLNVYAFLSKTLMKFSWFSVVSYHIFR